MTVQIGSQSGANQTPAAAEPTVAPSLGTPNLGSIPTPEAPKTPQPAFHDLTDTSGFMFGRGNLMHAQGGSELLTRATKAMQATFEANRGSLQASHMVEFVALDNQVHRRLPQNVCALVYSNKANPSVGSFVYLIQIVGSGAGRLSTQQFNVNGHTTNTEVLRLPCDTLLNQNAKEAFAALREQLAGRKLTYVSAISTTTDSFSWEDQEGQVKGLVAACFNDCAIAYQFATNTARPLNLAQSRAAAGVEVIVSNTRDNPQPRDLLGRPVRSDLTVQARTRANVNNQSGEVINESEMITQAHIYSELLFSPEVIDTNSQNAAGLSALGQVTRQVRTYRQRLVASSSYCTLTPTLAGRLLVIPTLLSLLENSANLHALMPSSNCKPRDFDDVTVLNVEAKVHIPEGAFSDEAVAYDDAVIKSRDTLLDFISRLVNPAIDLAIDVSVCGPDWKTGEVLVNAAMAQDGNIQASGDNAEEIKKANAAYREVIDTLNIMTNGAFSNHWGGGKLFEFSGVREVGQYPGADGNLYDTRTIDSIAVASMYIDRNPVTYREWTDSMSNRSPMTHAQRQAVQRKIIEAMVSPMPTYTQRVVQLTLTPGLVSALVAAYKEIQFTMTVSTPMTKKAETRFGFDSSNGLMPGVEFGMFKHQGLGGLGLSNNINNNFSIF